MLLLLHQLGELKIINLQPPGPCGFVFDRITLAFKMLTKTTVNLPFLKTEINFNF